jgi:tRNA(Ile)-lysidine synthase
MEPLAGIEPATYSLRVNCSTPELQRLWVGGRDVFNIKFFADKPKNIENCDDGSTNHDRVANFPSVSLHLHPQFLALAKRRKFLLGISGGRDSVALLYALLDAGYKNLVLCHLNHGLRGTASGQDAAFVRRLAKKFDVPYEIERVDIKQAIIDSGESMELAARNAWHTFFALCAKRHQCNRIILAHHADDQAETILFNLLRGSSGLRGMQFLSEQRVKKKKLSFFRPMLESSRSKIDRYIIANHIKYREDASNAEAIATRNRIRNEAIPLLVDIMGREISPALVRAAATSSAKDEALKSTLDSIQLKDPQGRLFLPKLIQLSPALQLMALHQFLKDGGVHNISHDLLERCQSLLTDTKTSKINLPGGLFLRRKEKRLLISQPTKQS